MKIALALALTCVSAMADDVYFPVQNFASGTVTNRKVLVTPLAVYPASGAASYDPVMYNSGTNGSFTVSNMTRGLYRCEIQAPPARSSFSFFVETNGTGGPLVNVGSIQRATPSEVKTPQDYAYSAQSSEARYLKPADIPPGIVTNRQTGVILTNGTVYDTAGAKVIDANGLYDGDGFRAYDRSQKKSFWSDGIGNVAVDWLTGSLNDQGGNAAIDLFHRQAKDEDNNVKLDWSSTAALSSSIQGAGIAAAVTDPLLILCGFDNAQSQGVQFKNYWSADGITFKRIGSMPIATVNYAGGYRLRDGRFYLRSNVWYINSLLKFNDNHSLVLSSTNFANWQSNSTVTCHASGTAWDTQFYNDPAGGTYLLFSRSADGVTGFQIYVKPVTNWNTFPADASFGSAVVLTNAAGGAIWTNMIGPSIVEQGGTYNLFFKQEDQGTAANRYIALAQAPSIFGPYTVVRSNNWMGIGYGFEGNSPIFWNGNWRIYFDINGTTNTALQNSVFVECPAANFPLGPWTGPTQLQCMDFLSNPGLMVISNITDQLKVYKAIATRSSADQPMTLVHGPYHDFIIGPNLKLSSANYQSAWNRLELIDTNQTGMAIFMDWDSSIWNFVTYTKPSAGAAAVPFTISSAGANGTLNGTTVSASTGFSSTGTGIGTFNTNATAPVNTTTPRVWFNITNGGQVFKMGGFQ